MLSRTHPQNEILKTIDQRKTLFEHGADTRIILFVRYYRTVFREKHGGSFLR